MLRNKEFFIYSIIAVSLTAAVSAICSVVNPLSGLICLAGCLGVFTLCIIFTILRYRKIAELSDYIKRLTGGKPALDIRENAEGELSILKNEIYKVTIALTEQTDALSKDKSELATALSDISHQLKTPLTSLGIMADLLEDDNLPPETRREFIASMRDRLSKMEWLVLSLLKLARLDADAVTFKEVNVTLSELVEKASAPLQIPMEIKAQTYHAEGDDASIICDPDWTAEALGNIIKNAAQNAPESGSVSVSYGANPLYAYIVVRDNGSGIDKADIPNLFKRFYRGKNASRDSVGIGLAMSLAVMRKQNGDIEAENDNGGVFTLKFYK